MSVVAGASDATVETILEDLNEEQREAVTHGDGPLLIVAGAGTGKTAVITRRIAWLIATKRARPEQILALTFTEKAAAEMESRVDVLVPYGYTGTTLSTFHAFGDRLVRSFGIELGISSRLRVCSDAEVRVFLRQRLFDLGLERYAPLGDPDRHLGALHTMFGRARDEDVSPEEYVAFAERLASEASGNPELEDRAAAEREKARAYARYRELMLEHGLVDFGDQLSLALRLLRERPHLRRQLQEQYRYILVDEFQDTNHAQFEMLRLLTGERHNLTVVGDDDQSIYRFRGAKLANLIAFLDTYHDARTVVLTRNYRSPQNLLDAAYRLIQHNDPDRLEAHLRVRPGAPRFDKRLRAARTGPAVVTHQEFATASDEADHVARTIAEELRAGRRSPRDFAILARYHRDLGPVLTALEAEGIPFQQAGQRRLYEREEVRLCLAMLRAVADPDDSSAVFQLLASPLFGAEGTDLARLTSLAHRRNVSVRQVLERIEREPLLFELADATREAVGRYLTLARRLAHFAIRQPTADVLYAFVHESGLLGQLTQESTPEAEEKVRNLAKLFTITKRTGDVLEQNRVHQFIRYLDLLIEAGDDPAAAEVDVELVAVRAATVHGAKGMEHPVVFLVALADQRFPGYARDEELPFPRELVKEPPTQGDANEEEERRLFYVGMTRSKEELHMSWAVDTGAKSRRRMSRFVAEALGIPARVPGRQPLSPRQAIERHAPAPVAPAATRPPLKPDDLLRLSSGRIDDYHTCPLKYRYAHEVQVPLATDPLFTYGEAIHNAILVYYQHRLRGYPIEAKDVIKRFEESWKSDGFISREHEERRLAQGRDTLMRFLERERQTPSRPIQVEQGFQFRVGPNLVTGRWDRIDEREEGIAIVDFKTSDVDEDEDATSRTMKSLRDGQLGLYALAYHETRHVTPRFVELHYVGSGATGSAEVTDEDLLRATERIATAAAGIRAAEFPPRPDYTSCRHCPFEIFCPHSVTRGGR